MKNYLILVVAIVAGAVIGAMVNMGIIYGSVYVVPPPVGVNVEDVASINAHIHEYSFVQLLFPFLAHAMGTLVGAWIASRFAPIYKLMASMVIGVLFLYGGYSAVQMIPNAPMWFDVLDLSLAYIPMAFLGYVLATRRSQVDN